MKYGLCGYCTMYKCPTAMSLRRFSAAAISSLVFITMDRHCALDQLRIERVTLPRPLRTQRLTVGCK